MAKFNIKAGILLEILNLVKCKGKSYEGDDTALISNCILDISKNKIQINATDMQEAVYVFITVTEFKCIEEGVIPVELIKANSKNTITATLERFNKDDDIEIEEINGIIHFRRFKPRKLTYKINTISENQCNCHLDMDLPHTYNEKQDIWVTGGGKKYTTKIQVNSKELKEVIKDGDRIAHRSYPILVSSKEVLITVFNRKTGEGSEREIDVKDKKVGTQPVGSLFSYGFGNVFSNFTGIINIWFYQDAALFIKQTKDQYDCVIIVSSDENTSEEELEEEINESIIDEIEVDLDEEDLKEISEDDLYIDYDENESVVENWDDKEDEKLFEEEIPKKEAPTMKMTVKELIEYAVINKIDIDYSAKKKEIFETIINALESE
jgi:hypothetical protein